MSIVTGPTGPVGVKGPAGLPYDSRRFRQMERVMYGQGKSWGVLDMKTNEFVEGLEWLTSADAKEQAKIVNAAWLATVGGMV